MAKPFFCYLLQCKDGSYYAGQTDDLGKRLAEHQNGLGLPYTRSRLPLQLVWQQEFGTRDEAKQAEKRLKGWSRAKKRALIAGAFEHLPLLAARNATARALRDAGPHQPGPAPQERGSLPPFTGRKSSRGES